MATPTTHRIGLIGADIDTSLSPLLHETEAAALGLETYAYELLDVTRTGIDPAQVGGHLRGWVAEGFTGFNVTHPCKQVVISALDALSPDARALGAVNTVTVEPDGRLVGHNTDHSGFARALHTGLGGPDLTEVVVLGAGGAGSAVAYALANAGAAHLVVVDTDSARADAIADRVKIAYPSTGVTVLDDASPALTRATGLVNATPIGMEGHPGVPVDPSLIAPPTWVADVVYRPVRTRLVEAAAERGCRTLDGTHMLIWQAADTFALLTGRRPDGERMHTHLGTVLAERSAA